MYARLQAIEALVEGGLAHRVIDDLDARAAGEPFDLGLEVGLRVEDDLVGVSCASARYSSVETVAAATQPPARLIICTSRWPTPPAAAVTTVLSPGLTG